jgi:Ca-activated chloride channel family protein
MTFLSPNRLWFLLVVALFAVAYLLMQNRRKSYAARLASAEMFDSVMPSRPGWRRHGTAVMFLTSMGILTTGFAQPARQVTVPRERATIIIAIDTSLSMEANDVDPTRLIGAQEAAHTFVDELPPKLNLGVVGFAGSASVLVPPTQERLGAHLAIDGLKLAESTAIGEAIFTSLDAIRNSPIVGEDGEPAPAAIVVLSDGETTAGRSDASAISAAQLAGIPISTIAFGTRDGVIIYDDPTTPQVEQLRVEVPVGEDNLRKIAEQTGGAFFQAASIVELEEVYNNIGSDIGSELVDREITDWFLGLGLVVLMASAIASLTWFQRLP